MLALLLLAAATHCADPGLCPTRGEFLAAVKDYDDEAMTALNFAANEADPDHLVLITPQRTLRVTGLYCGEAAEDVSVNCMAVFHHRRGRSFRTLRLHRETAGWKVESCLGVFRPN